MTYSKRNRLFVILASLLITSFTMLTRLEPKFIGALENHDTFLSVSSHDAYQFIRVISDKDKRVDYALYGSSEITSYMFESEAVNYEISYSILNDSDFLILELPFSVNESIQLTVYSGENIIDEVLFVYILDYEDARGLQYTYENHDSLMIHNYETQTVFSWLFLSNTQVLGLPFAVFMVLIMLGIIWFYVFILKHIETIFSQIRGWFKSKNMKKFLRFQRVLWIHFVGGVVLYLVTIVLLALFNQFEFTESSDVNTNVNIHYFDLIHEEKTISIYMGIDESIINDSDIGRHLVTYTFVYHESFDYTMVGSFVCGEEIFGHINIHAETTSAEIDGFNRQIKLYSKRDCADQNQFNVILRDPHTAKTIAVSKTYTLYKDYRVVQNDFNVALEKNSFLPSLIILGFHSIVSMSIIRHFYDKRMKNNKTV